MQSGSQYCTKNIKSTRFIKNVIHLSTYAEKKDTIRKNWKKMKKFEKKILKKLEFFQKFVKKTH